VKHLVVLAMLACAVAARAEETLPAAVFSYEDRKPPDVRAEGKSMERGAARIADISFASSTPGVRIKAYLVTPAARAPAAPAPAKAAGILWVHWLGDRATTNRTEFLGDAVALAGDGVVSLLVDAMWSQPGWFQKRTTDTDFAASLTQVRDLRRALDVLAAQPGVDAERLAFVGHDFGGMYGSVLAGIDGRPKWYVIIAVTTKLSDWYLLGDQPKDKQAYVAQMAPIEPLPYLRGARAQGFLFQFARTDRFVTPEHAKEYADAAPAEKRTEIYDSGHGLDIPKAHADRVAWLRDKLTPRP